jgi:hypothetical protein
MNTEVRTYRYARLLAAARAQLSYASKSPYKSLDVEFSIWNQARSHGKFPSDMHLPHSAVHGKLTA